MDCCSRSEKTKKDASACYNEAGEIMLLVSMCRLAKILLCKVEKVAAGRKVLMEPSTLSNRIGFLVRLWHLRDFLSVALSAYTEGRASNNRADQDNSKSRIFGENTKLTSKQSRSVIDLDAEGIRVEGLDNTSVDSQHRRKVPFAYKQTEDFLRHQKELPPFPKSYSTQGNEIHMQIQRSLG